MVVKTNRTSFLHRYGHHNTETMINTNPVQTGKVSSSVPTVGRHRLSNAINPVISHVGVNDGICCFVTMAQALVSIRGHSAFEVLMTRQNLCNKVPVKFSEDL